MSVQHDFSSFMEDASHFKTIPIIESFGVELSGFLLDGQKRIEPDKRRSRPCGGIICAFQQRHNVVMKKLFTAQQLKEVLEWMFGTCLIKTPELEIPFSGGAVGYLSYDAMPLI